MRGYNDIFLNLISERKTTSKASLRHLLIAKKRVNSLPCNIHLFKILNKFEEYKLETVTQS